MDQQTIRRRLSALLAKTVENGCTEAEQDAAIQMASGIAAKHGIDLESLYASGQAVRPKIVRKSKHQELKVYEAYCAEASAVIFGVECNAHNFGKYGFYYTGREDLVEIAEDTMLWLVNQIEALYKVALAARPGMTQRERKEFRETFKDACAERVFNRARSMVWQMQQDERAAQQSTGHTALVVRGHFTTLRAEIAEFHRNEYLPSPEQQARMLAAQEAERQDRLANPVKWAMIDKRREEEQKAWEKKEQARLRRQAKRGGGYGRPERQPKRGSGTQEGYSAGDQVRLRKELN